MQLSFWLFPTHFSKDVLRAGKLFQPVRINHRSEGQFEFALSQRPGVYVNSTPIGQWIFEQILIRCE